MWKYKRNYICIPIVFGWPMLMGCFLLWYGLNDFPFMPSWVLYGHLIWLGAFLWGKPE